MLFIDAETGEEEEEEEDRLSTHPRKLDQALTRSGLFVVGMVTGVAEDGPFFWELGLFYINDELRN